jgi:hypothetical protein
MGDVCKWQIVQVSGGRKGKEWKSGKWRREEGKKGGINEDGKGGKEREKRRKRGKGSEKRRKRGKGSELGKRREWREEKREKMKDEREKTDRMNEIVRVRVRVTESWWVNKLVWRRVRREEKENVFLCMTEV